MVPFMLFTQARVWQYIEEVPFFFSVVYIVYYIIKPYPDPLFSAIKSVSFIDENTTEIDTNYTTIIHIQYRAELFVTFFNTMERKDSRI